MSRLLTQRPQAAARQIVSGDRLIYTDANGDIGCITRHRGIVRIPSEFKSDLQTLATDLNFALDCIAVFGGIPVPVAKGIQHNLESAQTAIDLGLKSGDGKAPADGKN
jgi:hypothetical protein